MTPEGAIAISNRRVREYLERKRETGQAARKDVLASVGTERDAGILRRGFSCVGNGNAQASAPWLHRSKPVSSPALAPLSLRSILRACGVVVAYLALVVASWAGVWGLWRAVLWLGR